MDRYTLRYLDDDTHPRRAVWKVVSRHADYAAAQAARKSKQAEEIGYALAIFYGRKKARWSTRGPHGALGLSQSGVVVR